MVDIDVLKAHPERATPDDVTELIRLLELARTSLPSYADGQTPSPDGEIGDIKSAPRS
jgi:hypothetical protein